MSNATDNARSQAIAQVEGIAALVAALSVDYDRLQELRDEYAEMTEIKIRNWPKASELAELESEAGDCSSEDEAREAIENAPLSVEVRSDWASNASEFAAAEFRIVLCTGGPHVELQGELENGMPSWVSVIYSDWGTSGELFDFDHDAVLTYCQQFYFGE